MINNLTYKHKTPINKWEIGIYNGNKRNIEFIQMLPPSVGERQ